jgi:DNA-binding transcriptional LysR family regulator
MDIEQLRIFVEVVERGSFSAAARTMDLPPSAASRAVAALEDELSVRLLNRTTRRIALTEAGQAYLEQVRPALAGLHRAAEDARQSTGVAKGLVRITTSVSFGQVVIVPLLAALHRRYPELEVDLLMSDAVTDLVGERVDIAVRLGPPTDSSLVGLELGPIQYRVCASPVYLASHGRPRRPDDLKDCACLRFPLPGFRSQWKFRRGAQAIELVDVGGWLTVSSAMGLRQAALAGLGPALLPLWLVAQDLDGEALVDLFPDHEVTATNFDSAVWLLYASRIHLPWRVRAVIEFLKAHVPSAVGHAPSRA